MTLEEIQAINRATDAYIAARRAGKAPVSDKPVAYYGYVNIDMFDCPPFVMFTNDDSPAVQAIQTFGTYEPGSISVWCALARGASGILDVGASVGVYSMCAAKLRPDVKVHAIEPNPYAYARLRMHKHINGLNNLIEHSVALGQKNAIMRFAWAAKAGGNISSGGSITTNDGPQIESMVVPLCTLDAIGIAGTLGPRPLIKIDVEGTELRVFRGLGDLVNAAPDIIVETFRQDVCDEVGPAFAALGYKFYIIREHGRTLELCEKMAPAAMDGDDFNQLLTRRLPSELAMVLPKDFAIRTVS